MAATDFETEIKQLQATMKTIGSVLDLDAMREEIADLGEQVAAPDLWDDQANAQRVTGRLSVLQHDIDRYHELESRLEDLGVMVELAAEEDDADAAAETEAELKKLKKQVEQLEVRTLLSGDYDAREAIISVCVVAAPIQSWSPRSSMPCSSSMAVTSKSAPRESFPSLA